VLDKDSLGEGDVKDQLSEDSEAEEPLPKKKVAKIRSGGKKKAAMKTRDDINAHRKTAPIRAEVRECC
jgi:hypothetical protein